MSEFTPKPEYEPIPRDLEPMTAEQIALRALIDELFKRIDKIK